MEILKHLHESCQTTQKTRTALKSSDTVFAVFWGFFLSVEAREI